MTYRIRVSIYCLATRRRTSTTPEATAKIPSAKAALISEPVGGSGGVLLCGGGGVSPGGGGGVVLGGVVCDGGGGVMSEGGTVHSLVIKNPPVASPIISLRYPFTSTSEMVYSASLPSIYFGRSVNLPSQELAAVSSSFYPVSCPFASSFTSIWVAAAQVPSGFAHFLVTSTSVVILLTTETV